MISVPGLKSVPSGSVSRFRLRVTRLRGIHFQGDSSAPGPWLFVSPWAGPAPPQEAKPGDSRDPVCLWGPRDPRGLSAREPPGPGTQGLAFAGARVFLGPRACGSRFPGPVSCALPRASGPWPSAGLARAQSSLWPRLCTRAQACACCVPGPPVRAEPFQAKFGVRPQSQSGLSVLGAANQVWPPTRQSACLRRAQVLPSRPMPCPACPGPGRVASA